MALSRRICDRLAEAYAAAALLGEARSVVHLAAEAMGAVSPHGLALAFVRATPGTTAAFSGGERLALPRGSSREVPWVVDIDHVPVWQRDHWIEPIRAGVHGPDYFSNSHPVTRMFKRAGAIDYGRMMVCHEGRLVAWMGVYVPADRGFKSEEREALMQICAQLGDALRLAAFSDSETMSRTALAPRQEQIVSRLALGWSNKRIAADLGISVSTVKTMLERLYRAKGVKSRAALVGWQRAR